MMYALMHLLLLPLAAAIHITKDTTIPIRLPLNTTMFRMVVTAFETPDPANTHVRLLLDGEPVHVFDQRLTPN